jgi:hypothetical protein
LLKNWARPHLLLHHPAGVQLLVFLVLGSALVLAQPDDPRRDVDVAARAEGDGSARSRLQLDPRVVDQPGVDFRKLAPVLLCRQNFIKGTLIFNFVVFNSRSIRAFVR